MSFALVQSGTIQPESNAVILAEAIDHLFVVDPEAFPDVQRKLTEAITDAEGECGCPFVSRQFTYVLDEFPRWRADNPDIDVTIRLPMPPCVSIESVKYIDTNGVQQTLATTEYHKAIRGKPARIVPANGKQWPDTLPGKPESVEIAFTAGFGDRTQVPDDIKAAIKLILGDRWRNRGEEGRAERSIPLGARRILDNYRGHLL